MEVMKRAVHVTRYGGMVTVTTVLDLRDGEPEDAWEGLRKWAELYGMELEFREGSCSGPSNPPGADIHPWPTK